MNISYFPQYTASKSEPVWRSFLEGCKKNNITPVENSLNADAAVIWSVLWHGKMQPNQAIYQHYISQQKPVFIIEVGCLKRGETWKICVNNINRFGIYPIDQLDKTRPQNLNIQLNENNNRTDSILIATQHPKSLQWTNMPSIEQWVDQTVIQLRKITDRPIIVRPHPRWPISVPYTIEHPKKIPNTYDIYDLDFNYHCVVNYSSGPSVQSAIAGTPIICDTSSLAAPVSIKIQDIETAIMPNREDWFLKLCHTEWTLKEIENGIPQHILLKKLTK